MTNTQQHGLLPTKIKKGDIMPQLLFDFNPHNNRAENVVPNVNYATPVNGTARRFIIPNNAPFFREGHSVFSNGVRLVEGKDYYLALKYHTATHITAKEVYGAIWITPRVGIPSITLTCNTLGSTYSVDRTVATAFVNSRIEELQSLAWEDVLGIELFFPPVNVQFDRDGWKDEVKLTESITSVANALATRVPEDNVLYVVMREWLSALRRLLDSVPVSTHASNKNNPHGHKWHTAKALKSNGIAADASKAYNKTLAELVTYINERGVVQTDLDKCMLRLGDKTMTGDLVGKTGAASFANTAMLAQLDLSTKCLTVLVKNSIVLAADADMNQSGKKATLSAGLNKLTVTSSGSVENHRTLKYNDEELLHAGNLVDYPPSLPVRVIAVNHANTSTVTLSGVGTTSSPLTATAVFPQANSSQPGTAMISNSINEPDRFKVATSKAANLLLRLLDDKVPDTRTVNNRRLNADIIIIPSDIGLGNVPNVSDANMPVNDKHRALLVNKASKVHRHTPAQVSAPNATASVNGIAMLSDDMSSTSTTKALSGKVVKEKYAELTAVDAKLPTMLPDDVIDITQYGGNSYLPIPIAGAYGEAGDNRAGLSIVGLIEQDGTLVLLRNGADSFGAAVYYWYASTRSDGSFFDPVSTSVKYAPKYLIDKGFTSNVKYIKRGSDSAFIAVNDDGTAHLILTFGTMNMTKHVGAAVSFSDGGVVHYNQNYPIVLGDKVYIIGTELNSDIYSTRVWWCWKADVVNDTAVVMQPLSLSGTGYYGHVQNAVAKFLFAPQGIGDPSNRQHMVVDDSNGFWTTRNVRHGPMSNYDVELSGNVVRVMHVASIYLANSYTSRWGGNWKTSYTINLVTGEVKLDHSTGFPVKLTAGSFEFTGSSLMTGTHAIFAANNTSGVVASKGQRYAWGYSNITAPSSIQLISPDGPGSHFDNMHAMSGYSMVARQSSTIKGNYGSPIEATSRGYIMLPNNYYALKHYVNSTHVLAQYDPNGKYSAGDAGIGPTTNRITITEERYLNLLAVPTIVDANRTIRNQGYIWTSLTKDKVGYCEIVNNDVTARTVSLGNGVWDNLVVQLSAKIPEFFGPGIELGTVATITLYGDHRVPADREMIVTLGALAYKGVGDPNKTNCIITYIATFTVSGDVITAITPTTEISKMVNASAVAGIYVQPVAMASSTRAITTSGDTYYVVGNLPVHSTVGGAAGYVQNLWKKPNGTYVSGTTYGAGPYYSLTSLHYLPILGQFSLAAGAAEESAVFYARGETPESWGTVSRTGIFSATKVAEGWIIYFTQSVPFFISTNEYTIPPTTLDISALFPTTKANNTFYLYATVVGGVAKYDIRERKEADTTSSIYIGYCTTNAVAITELVADRATRLGKFRELTEHNAALIAHGVDTSALSSERLGLGNVVNSEYANYDRGQEVFNRNSYGTLEHFKQITSWNERLKVVEGEVMLNRHSSRPNILDGAIPYVNGVAANNTIVWAELIDLNGAAVYSTTVRISYGSNIVFEITSLAATARVKYVMLTMPDSSYIYQVPTVY